MKIGFVISDSSLGRGGERVTATLANTLVSKEHTVTIVSLYQTNENTLFHFNPSIDHFAANRAPISKNPYFKFRQKISELITVFKIIKKSDVDVWVGVATYSSILLGIASLFYPSKKYIAWEHSNYQAAPGKWKKIRSVLYKRHDAIVCLNPTDQLLYLNEFRSVFVIPNLISFKTNSKSDLNSKLILSVGALEYEKGFDLLLKAFAELSGLDDWRLRIVGEGSMKSKLSDFIKLYNLEDKVELIGFQKNILEEYLNASIYVLPSRREGFGMVLIEAMECGLPCIAFNCPTGPANIIEHEKNGMLVSPEDHIQLAHSIKRVADNFEMAKELRDNAKKNVSKYYSEVVTKNWEDLFIQITG